MDMAVWILICLFFSIGLVQCGFWFISAFRKSDKLRRGYHILPLYDDANQLEAQVRFALSQIGSEGEFVLLVDMGLGEECSGICDKLIGEIGGLYICAKDNLVSTIEKLDNLQIAKDDVE